MKINGLTATLFLALILATTAMANSKSSSNQSQSQSQSQTQPSTSPQLIKLKINLDYSKKTDPQHPIIVSAQFKTPFGSPFCINTDKIKFCSVVDTVQKKQQHLIKLTTRVYLMGNPETEISRPIIIARVGKEARIEVHNEESALQLIFNSEETKH